MIIQVFGTKKCRSTQKALRFFKERNVDVQFRDLEVKPPSPLELDDLARGVGGFDLLIDPDSPGALRRGLAYLDYDAREELLRDPGIYRTPLVRIGPGRAVIGVDEKALAGLLA